LRDDALTLFLNNLPYSVNEEKIKSKFTNPDKVLDIRIIRDKD